MATDLGNSAAENISVSSQCTRAVAWAQDEAYLWEASYYIPYVRRRYVSTVHTPWYSAGVMWCCRWEPIIDVGLSCRGRQVAPY